MFDYQPGDVFACVADLCWITGHSYVVYGPLCNGATTVLFESTATYPDAGMLSWFLSTKANLCTCCIFISKPLFSLSKNTGRYWNMVERLKVNQFFTVPSAIRLLMKDGDELVTKYNLSSLKTIASSEYVIWTITTWRLAYSGAYESLSKKRKKECQTSVPIPCQITHQKHMPYMDINLLVLTVTTMDSQDLACCNKSHRLVE